MCAFLGFANFSSFSINNNEALYLQELKWQMLRAIAIAYNACMHYLIFITNKGANI